MTEQAKTIWRLHQRICNCLRRLSDHRLGPARVKAFREAIKHDTKEFEHELGFVALGAPDA
jgi:hypothetical protein